MPEENYQKIKLLKIMEILRQETDEEHPMTKVELAARLVAMNVSCSPRSLIRDIKLLNEQGYEIMERLIGHEKAYFVCDRSFSVPELKILIDAVQAASFVTNKKTGELIDKIAALGGSHRAAILNLDAYKMLFSKANGSGKYGETIALPIIAIPTQGHTQTFISIGNFATREEAEAEYKYVQTKFARALLGILKVTQDNKKSVWKYVPQQDFTGGSDIDWSKPIADIDRQLYAKYGFDADEIAFVETNVKEMA